MLHQSGVMFGRLQGIFYDFDDAGDVLPMHTHGPSDAHITIVNRGSIKAHGYGWEMELKPGQVANWEVGQAHEFTALEPNSRIINIVKGAA
jgi:quercetin dioxygenase-like cupin family protein